MRISDRMAALVLSLATVSGQEPKADLPKVHTSITITAAPVEPTIDHRNKEVFEQTLFSRDDQVFHQLNAGINAGQHEGGGQVD